MSGMSFNDRETATILAALRYWQKATLWDRSVGAAAVIASDDGRFAPLNSAEIDVLCEKVNTP